MPAMTNILVKDDAATPKVWTLIPVTDTPNPFWRANDAAIPLDGQPRLNISMQQLKNGSYKITAKLEVPTMETLGASGTSSGYVAPPKTAYVTTAIVTMFADRRSTSQDRSNTLKMIVGIMQGASSTVDTGTLNNLSGGSGFLNSTLPGPSTFTSVILPN